jgi:hypothetical protein
MNNINQAGQKFINLGNAIIMLLLGGLVSVLGPFLIQFKFLNYWLLFWGGVEMILVIYVIAIIFEAGRLLKSVKCELNENQNITKEKNGSQHQSDENNFLPNEYPKLVADLNFISSELRGEQRDIMIEFLLSMSRNYSIPKQLRERNVDLANRLTKLPISSFTSLYEKKREDVNFIKQLEEYLTDILK